MVAEFFYTGAAETMLVPAGYTSVTVWLWGGAGGNGGNGGAISGAGGIVRATFPCSPGDTLKFEIAQGGRGAAANANGGLGGWPDGGDGGKSATGAGGGGGSTRFYINNVLKAVAAGGGGACSSGIQSGAGGGLVGQDTAGGSFHPIGGTQSAAGYDTNWPAHTAKYGRSIIAYPGVQRTGGYGSQGGASTSTSDPGGGGGGGYWGGGGGGSSNSAGGAGGSSWTDTDASGVIHNGGTRRLPAFKAGNNTTAGQGTFGATGGVHGGNGHAFAFFGSTYGIAGDITNTTNQTIGNNGKVVIPVTLPDCLAKWAHVHIPWTNSTNHRFVIYADNAGSPGALIGTAGPVNANFPNVSGVEGLLTFDLADLPLSAGNYWIGQHHDLSQRIGSRALTGGARTSTSDTYSDGSSNPFGSASVNNSSYRIALFYEEV